MSANAKAELRLVETPGDVRALFPGRQLDQRRSRWLLWMLLVSVVPFLMSLTLDSPEGVLAGVLVSAVLAAVVGVTVGPRLFRFVRITSHGVFVRPIALRDQLVATVPIAKVRAGEDDPWCVLAGGEDEAFLFGDTVAIGFTDYSLWFEDARGERRELLLETLSRADIERLHGTIEPMWRRSRAGMTDTDASADEARGRLASMAARREGQG